jgi:hypothetical protein
VPVWLGLSSSITSQWISHSTTLTQGCNTGGRFYCIEQ